MSASEALDMGINVGSSLDWSEASEASEAYLKHWKHGDYGD
jgi:hypothetical protein